MNKASPEYSPPLSPLPPLPVSPGSPLPPCLFPASPASLLPPLPLPYLPCLSSTSPASPLLPLPFPVFPLPPLPLPCLPTRDCLWLFSAASSSNTEHKAQPGNTPPTQKKYIKLALSPNTARPWPWLYTTVVQRPLEQVIHGCCLHRDLLPTDALVSATLADSSSYAVRWRVLLCRFPEECRPCPRRHSVRGGV